MGCGCLWGVIVIHVWDVVVCGGLLSSMHGAWSSVDGKSLSMGTGSSSSVDPHVPWMVVGH